MADIVLETARALVLGAVLIYVWRRGGRHSSSRYRGWNAILGGLVLLTAGAVLDVTDNFEQLNRFVVIGDTPEQAFLEKIVASLGGTALLATGLITWLATLRSTSEALRRSHESLEASIEERTAELRHANDELEAFSYSVSHDLRAPLRAVGAYATLLREEYGDRLDAEIHSYLGRIDDVAHRAGTLVDDLLSLAQVSRVDLALRPLSVTEIAGAVAGEIAKRYPTRNVEFRVDDGLRAHGDARLVHAALVNLLDNAWKFSSNRDPAHITVSAAPIQGDEPNMRAFAVSDDGVGFDMRYADKLFAPFWRLHHDNDCEGTGVGLATVARIVNRLGGRVWAESEPDHGATFYFTLPAAL